MTVGAKSSQSSYAAPAVDGMLDIIEHLAAHHSRHGVTELSRELGLSTNLVFRIMKRLVARNYAAVDESGGYQLGSQFFSLGMKLYHRFELRRLARPFLRELCQACGETCQLQVPDGDRMLVAEVLTPESDYYLQIVPGSRIYYHANAFGKCILAHLPESELTAMLMSDLPALTAATITDAARLRRELDEVRRTGLAHDRGEYLDGIYCLAAPVFDCAGQAIASVGVTGLSSRLHPTDGSKLEAGIRACAAAIAEVIGARQNDADAQLQSRSR